MASFKQYLYTCAAAAALATTLVTPALAQYHQFRSDKPTVEVDLDALAPQSATPAARPGWQKPAENSGHLPPVVLRQPLPPQPPQQEPPRTAPAEPVIAAPAIAAPQATPERSPAVSTQPAPRRVLKPIFAAPVAPPVAEAQPVQPLAEPKPARTPVAAPAVNKTAPPRQRIEALAPVAAIAAIPETPPSALPPAKLMEPIYEKQPEPPRPAPKPAQIAAPQPQEIPSHIASAQPEAIPPADSRISYPPIKMPRSDVRHFERPVLPEGLRTDEYAAPVTPVAAPATVMSALPAESLPQRKPPVTELPATILNDDDMAALTTYMPAEAAAPPAETVAIEPPVPAAAIEQPQETLQDAAPRRPSLVIIDDAPVELPRRMPVTTTLSVPPAQSVGSDMPAAEDIAALPAPKPLENIPPPLTESELAEISQNIETVPARVAKAPPRLLPQDIVVPTLADLTLEFDGTSSELNENTRQKLVNIVPHLTESESRRLAVHAYASGEDGSKSSARRISLSRALAVRAFLMDNGVPPTRVDVRALGLETDRKPLERVDLVFAR